MVLVYVDVVYSSRTYLDTNNDTFNVLQMGVWTLELIEQKIYLVKDCVRTRVVLHIDVWNKDTKDEIVEVSSTL